MDVENEQGAVGYVNCVESEAELLDRLLSALEKVPKGSNKQIILKIAKEENLPPRIVARTLMPKRYLSRKPVDDDSDADEPMEQTSEAIVTVENETPNELPNIPEIEMQNNALYFP